MATSCALLLACLPAFMEALQNATNAGLEPINTLKIVETYDLVRHDADANNQRALDGALQGIERAYQARVQKATDAGELTPEVLEHLQQWRDERLAHYQQRKETVWAERAHLQSRKTTYADLGDKRVRVETVDTRDLDALTRQYHLDQVGRWNLDETAIWVYDSDGAVWWKPNMPGDRYFARPEPYDEDFMRLRLGFLPAWVFDASNGYTWTQAGDAIVGRRGSTTQRFELRAGSCRVQKLIITRTGDSQPTTYELQNWKTVGDVLLPHQLTIDQPGVKRTEHVVTQYELNPVIDPAKFAPPAGRVLERQ